MKHSICPLVAALLLALAAPVSVLAQQPEDESFGTTENETGVDGASEAGTDDPAASGSQTDDPEMPGNPELTAESGASPPAAAFAPHPVHQVGSGPVRSDVSASAAPASGISYPLDVVSRPAVLPPGMTALGIALDFLSVDEDGAEIDFTEVIFLDLEGRIATGAAEIGLATRLLVKQPDDSDATALQSVGVNARVGGQNSLFGSLTMHTPAGEDFGATELRTLDLIGGVEARRKVAPNVQLRGEIAGRFLNTLADPEPEDALWNFLGAARAHMVLQATPSLALMGGLELLIPLAVSPEEAKDDISDSAFNLRFGGLYAISPTLDLFAGVTVLDNQLWLQPTELFIDQNRYTMGMQSRF